MGVVHLHMIMRSVPTEEDDGEHDDKYQWCKDERHVELDMKPSQLVCCGFGIEVRVRQAPHGPCSDCNVLYDRLEQRALLSKG